MDQVTQQNAAMVEEPTAASRTLASEAAELTRLIGQFTIGATKLASRPAASARTVTALKMRGLGGATRKPDVQAEAAWEEF